MLSVKTAILGVYALCSLLNFDYLAAGLLVSLFDLLPLLIAPFHQNVNYGVLIHTLEKGRVTIKSSSR